MTIPFYSNENKNVMVEIYHKEVLVNSKMVKADKGYNEVEFDISFLILARNHLKKRTLISLRKAQTQYIIFQKETLPLR